VGREEVAPIRIEKGLRAQPFFIPHMICIGIGGFLLACTLCLVPHGTVMAQERIRIVGTTTDLKSLADAIGGDRVSVVSLVPANVDAEDYQPKPHDLNRLKDAKLVLRVGLDYDLWLDRLVAQTQRPELRRGGAGYVDCSFAIALLDVRGAQVGPAGGHAHGSGNPHYWLDPQNAEIITGTLLEAFARNDPANAKYYDDRRRAFLERLTAKIAEWGRMLVVVQGKPMIAHHNSWAYLARRFRLNFAGYIEPRPGIPPSPSHFAGLLSLMASQRIKVIVRQPHEPATNADFLAGKTGAKVMLLVASVGAVPQARDYLSLFDYNVDALLTAHGR
jgi:ABC-type Zn uptake system ZnuABC Zn-binding protein ZnuA